jgi:hypothetical protein
MIWNMMRRCTPIRLGLERAGFSGGWLDEARGATSNIHRKAKEPS